MRAIVATCCLVMLLGCADKPAEPSPDTLTRRERDSIIGASALPGAAGVNGALRATDSAGARRAREQAISDSQ
jgi:hypothetical protein